MKDTIYIIGQILGGVAIALGFLSYQMKTQKCLLIAQILTCIVFCLHYLMIGAISGMALNAVCFLRNLVYYYLNQRKGGCGRIVPLAFAVLLGIIGIITWEAWYSVFVFLGLVLNTLALSFSNPQRVRGSILITSPLVLIYDVFAFSIGGIVYESVAIVSSVIGLARFYKAKRDSSSDN